MFAFARPFLRSIALRSSDWRKMPSGAPDVVIWAAKAGYAVRGVLYLSIGAAAVSAAIFSGVQASSPTTALGWIAQQPFSWLWLAAASGGLLCFASWRVLQGVFDVDREGFSADALATRFSQACSALGYLALAWIALSLIVHAPSDPSTAEIVQTHRRADQLLSLPHGEWLLGAIGVAVAGVGLGNVSRGLREDFTTHLACSDTLCRWFSPMARLGYLARGLAYVPLAVLVLLGAFRARPEDVTSLGGALDSLAASTPGKIVLAIAGLGLIAFGSFSLIEARFRRIRPAR